MTQADPCVFCEVSEYRIRYAPNNTFWHNFSFKDLFKDVKNCIANVGLPAIANALNPGSIGLSTVADAASSMSQSATLAAGVYSVGRGLIQPLSSSAVRSAFTGPKLPGGSLVGAETLGKISAVATVGNFDIGLGAGVMAEWNGCL